MRLVELRPNCDGSFAAVYRVSGVRYESVSVAGGGSVSVPVTSTWDEERTVSYEEAMALRDTIGL